MIYKIEYSIPSRKDIKDSVEYISYQLKNKIAAHRLTGEVNKLLDILSETPKRSPIVRDRFLAMYGIRLARVKNYLLLSMKKPKRYTFFAFSIHAEIGSIF